MNIAKPEYTPEELAEIQRKADTNQSLVAYPEWKEHYKDLTELQNAYIDKLLGNWETGETSIKTYEEYRATLGIIHGLIKAAEAPNKYIAEAINLQK